MNTNQFATKRRTLAALLAALNTRRRFAWTRQRIDLTRQLVEGMIAHRTEFRITRKL